MVKWFTILTESGIDIKLRDEEDTEETTAEEAPVEAAEAEETAPAEEEPVAVEAEETVVEAPKKKAAK